MKVPRNVAARDVVRVFHRVLRRRLGLPLEVLDALSPVFDKEKEKLIRAERFLLRSLGFQGHVTHANAGLALLLDLLPGIPHHVAQRALTFTHASNYALHVHAAHAPLAVAAAALHLAGVWSPDDPYVLPSAWHTCVGLAAGDVAAAAAAIWEVVREGGMGAVVEGEGRSSPAAAP